MKKFKLTQINKPAPDGVLQKTKLYSIYLAPGCHHYFKSYREAKNFAVDYSKSINQAMHSFNFLLVQLYTAHRAAWFYYYDSASGKNATTVETAVNNTIGEIERNMHQAAFNCSGTWGAGRIWAVVCNIVQALVKGFETLGKFLFTRRLYAECERMKIHAAHANTIFSQLCTKYSLTL